MLRAGLVLLAVTGLWAGGCAGQYESPLSNTDPSVKIPAMKKAVQHKDATLATRRQLVTDLDSDDPAVRLYAIHALEGLTGQRLGYEHYLDRDQRQPALNQWRQWLAEQEADPPTSQPSDPAPKTADINSQG
ncbi:MAG: hypothetical protein ACM359_05720 [Bacillota bacterium]